MLSQEVAFAHCVLFSAATVLTRLVSIAPGGIGVREALVAAVATTLGFDPVISMVVAGLDRLLETFITVVLGVIYSYILSKYLSNDLLVDKEE